MAYVLKQYERGHLLGELIVWPTQSRHACHCSDRATLGLASLAVVTWLREVRGLGHRSRGSRDRSRPPRRGSALP